MQTNTPPNTPSPLLKSIPRKAYWLGALCAVATTLQAAVPSADTTLQPIRTDNMTVFTSLTGYSVGETTASGSNAQWPLYAPYNSSDPAWWDNLLAEQLQARLPVIMCATRGVYTLSGTDWTGPGNMNPRRLVMLNDAITRANASSLVKVACFVDTPAFRIVANYVHTGSKTAAVMDLSIQSDWNDVFWLRGIKPWFDTVPQSLWYTIGGKPVIQFWGIASEGYWFSNANGNFSQLLNFLAAQFQATYGVTPAFILDKGIFRDTTINPTTVPTVIGENGWFAPPGTSYTNYVYNGSCFATAVAGFIDPNFYIPGAANYQNYNRVIFRNLVSGTGANGDTLKAGMAGAISGTAKLAVLEGWTDVEESAGLYRSEGEPEWSFPNQYINIIRSYSDPRTVTLRLEAEGCDSYYKTFKGQASGIFRRSGDLVIRNIGSSGTTGWAVTKTNAGEWLEFKSIHFSAGNYKFPIKYASPGAHTLRLYVDGTALPDVAAPATGGTNTWNTIYLGTKALTHGNHTLRLQFVDGGVDVDWVFARKYDPLMSFRCALNNCYLTAELGGNNKMVSNRTAESVWERFSINDLTGAGTVNNLDTVSLQVCNGRYLCAEGGGGRTLSPNRSYPGAWETMTIVKLNGSGALVTGDQVAIKTQLGNYITVKSDNSVDASSTTVGAAQTFTIKLSAQ